jgi:hypothetical protein
LTDNNEKKMRGLDKDRDNAVARKDKDGQRQDKHNTRIRQLDQERQGGKKTEQTKEDDASLFSF